MSSTRYTVFQYFPGNVFNQANQGATEATTGPAYQCPWSQRAPQFQWKEPLQKQAYDAAITSCCNTPVTPFYSFPQYQIAGAAPKAQPCSQSAAKSSPWEKPCPGLTITTPGGGVAQFCGNALTYQYQFKVQCPQYCTDLPGLQTAGPQYKSYGTFAFVAKNDPWNSTFGYTPDQSLITSAYNTCAGTVAHTETYCGDKKLTWQINAGLGNEGGCYCDCCNTNGQFSAPSGTITAPSMTATFNLTYTIGGTAQITACRAGTLSGIVYPNIGTSFPLPWTSGPVYQGDSSAKTRYVTGTPGTIGSSGVPACCGATVTYSGNDGCGHNSTLSKVLAAPYSGSTWNYAAGTIFAESTSYNIVLSGACNLSPLASMTLGYTNLTTTGQGTVTTTTNQIQKITGGLTFSNSFAARGCCGSGAISASSNDGCNHTVTSPTWQVRRAVNGAAQIGAVLSCRQSGNYYYHNYVPLYCDGTQGTTWTQIGAPYTTVASCVTGISATSNPDITGSCNNYCGSYSGSGCCYYGNNGLTGTAFMAAVFCVNDTNWATSPVCCKIPASYRSNMGWVYQTGSYCCPGTSIN